MFLIFIIGSAAAAACYMLLSIAALKYDVSISDKIKEQEGIYEHDHKYDRNESAEGYAESADGNSGLDLGRLADKAGSAKPAA